MIDAAPPLTKPLHDGFLKRLVMPIRLLEANKRTITNIEEAKQEVYTYRCNILEDHRSLIENKSPLF